MGWPIGYWPSSRILSWIWRRPRAYAVRLLSPLLCFGEASGETPRVRYVATRYSIGRRTFWPTAAQNSEELNSVISTGLIMPLLAV